MHTRARNGSPRATGVPPCPQVGLRKYASVRRSTFGLDGKKRIAVLRASGAILGARTAAAGACGARRGGGHTPVVQAGSGRSLPQRPRPTACPCWVSGGRSQLYSAPDAQHPSPLSPPKGSSSSAGSNTITPDAIIPKLRALAKDKGTAAVVLRVDSPGGDALASDLMWREIKQLGRKKPVIACMGAEGEGEAKGPGRREAEAANWSCSLSLGVGWSRGPHAAWGRDHWALIVRHAHHAGALASPARTPPPTPRRAAPTPPLTR